MAKRLKHLYIENTSGLKIISNKDIVVIKEDNFKPYKISIGGDAPKDVIKLYQYGGNIRKQRVKSWPTYIAKVGQKWYPNESITEQLITEIGDTIGIEIANSKLFNIEGVIRFCSKHFHSREQVLSHGAEILSIFRNEPDQVWIDELEKNKQIKESININEIIDALKSTFQNENKTILTAFFDMLLFDCLVGNNDRHYYNWGIITHIEGKHPPYFSPIYDTARALWWNLPDSFIVSLSTNQNRKQVRLKSYIKKSRPKISTPENTNCNHFELITYLIEKDYITKEQKELWTDETTLDNICEVIENKFCKLMIKERISLIKETLNLRFLEICKVFEK